jgi:hypothetical protein
MIEFLPFEGFQKTVQLERRGLTRSLSLKETYGRP